jgi:hypothetical protein
MLADSLCILDDNRLRRCQSRVKKVVRNEDLQPTKATPVIKINKPKARSSKVENNYQVGEKIYLMLKQNIVDNKNTGSSCPETSKPTEKDHNYKVMDHDMFIPHIHSNKSEEGKKRFQKKKPSANILCSFFKCFNF